ncbi:MULTISPECIES: TolB family protein [Hyphobacterium]|uniref:TolB family protein n=1 Tax=Hyphobacterium vulgare TaxID=1736751 RepID=A0ABV6ZY48_9PROT
MHRVLLAAGLALFLSGPAISGDIYFTSPRSGDWEVYRLSPEGQVENLTNRSGSTEWVYAAYPGELLILTNDGADCGRACYHMEMVDPETGEISRLGNTGIADTYMGRSPDGQRFVTALWREDRQHDLVIVDRTGAITDRLTEDAFKNTQADWSPDGRQIVFHSNRGGAFDLWMFDLESRAFTRLTRDPGNDDEQGFGGEGPARFSPDGSRLAWMHYSEDHWRVCLMSLPAGMDICIPQPEGGAEDSYPSWTPDGHVLFARSIGGGDRALLRFDPESGSVTELLGPEGDNYGPVTPPEG